ncbi:MAG: hypothetical protein MZV70_48625 [Desulfobacterales bacterium]|nr:hypothetical protein [Desulfobacterales bacterium]
MTARGTTTPRSALHDRERRANGTSASSSTIVENEKLFIRDISFEGNRTFTTKELKNMMTTNEWGIFSLLHRLRPPQEGPAQAGRRQAQRLLPEQRLHQRPGRRAGHHLRPGRDLRQDPRLGGKAVPGRARLRSPATSSRLPGRKPSGEAPDPQEGFL